MSRPDNKGNHGGFKTQSDVFLAADGFMYFRGTDNKVWRVSTDGTTVRSNPGGFTTHSDVRIGADGLMYFRGTDDKVWRVSTDGTTVRDNVGGFTTQSETTLYPDSALGPNPRFVSRRAWGMYFCLNVNRTKMIHVKHFGTIRAYSGQTQMPHQSV